MPDIASSIALPAALPATLITAHVPVDRLCLYAAVPAGLAANARPLLLIHSVNAAASAAEMRPLFEHYRAQRPVYALDLPGYGLSDRSRRIYSARLMTDAVHELVAEVRRRHDGASVDALALSLSCEFLARAAQEAPASFHSIGLVSPTGFNRGAPFDGPPLSNRGSARVHRALAARWLAPILFRLLTRPAVVRYFLQRTWGAKQIDAGLHAYCVLTTRMPGAEHAPLYFLSALLFSADISRVYHALGLPVWMVHGVRGDFTDYRWKSALADRPNWHFDVMQTGALPHFEQLERFCSSYEHFLAHCA